MVLLKVLYEPLKLIKLLLLLLHQLIVPLLLQLDLLLELTFYCLLTLLVLRPNTPPLLLKLLLQLLLTLLQLIKLLLLTPLQVLYVILQLLNLLVPILRLQDHLNLLLHLQLINLLPHTVYLHYLLLVLLSRNQELISELSTHTILIQLNLILLLLNLIYYNRSIQSNRKHIIIIKCHSQPTNTLVVALHLQYLTLQWVLTYPQCTTHVLLVSRQQK